jgi:hypothetical protein
MTLRKLANTKETAARMIEAEYTINIPAHQYFGVGEVKSDVETRINQLKEREQKRKQPVRYRTRA